MRRMLELKRNLDEKNAAAAIAQTASVEISGNELEMI